MKLWLFYASRLWEAHAFYLKASSPWIEIQNLPSKVHLLGFYLYFYLHALGSALRKHYTCHRNEKRRNHEEMCQFIQSLSSFSGTVGDSVRKRLFRSCSLLTFVEHAPCSTKFRREQPSLPWLVDLILTCANEQRVLEAVYRSPIGGELEPRDRS